MDRIRIEDVAKGTGQYAISLARPESDGRMSQFTDLCLRRLDLAYRLAWAFLERASDAEEATQEAFATAWRRRSSLRDAAGFEAWFDRILIADCADRLRRISRYRPDADVASEPWLDGHDAFERREAQKDLVAGWGELLDADNPTDATRGRDLVTSPDPAPTTDDPRPASDNPRDSLEPDQRIVLVLAYWADFATREIAERIGLSVEKTERRLRDAMVAISPSLPAGNDTDAERSLRRVLRREITPPLAAPYSLRHAVETREIMQPVRRRARRPRRAILAGGLGVTAAMILAAVGLATPRLPAPVGGNQLPMSVEHFGRVDGRTGWATSGTSIYITGDDGATWRKGTLPFPVDNGSSGGALYGGSAISFIDASHGWEVVQGTASPDGAFPVSVSRTKDGGRSWATANVEGQFSSLGPFLFLDEKHGWLIAVRAPQFAAGDGPSADPAAIYTSAGSMTMLTTADAGATWHEVAGLPPMFQAGFESADAAWAIGSDTGESLSLFRIPQDGGSVVASSLPLVQGCTPTSIVRTPARTADGLRLVLACIDFQQAPATGPDSSTSSGMSQEVVAFTSHDNGRTWSQTARTPIDVPGAAGVGVPPPSGRLRQPLMLFMSDVASMRISFDEGASWKGYSLSGLSELPVWSSAEDAWARMSSGAGSSPGLYSTKDGGKTWRPLLGSPPWTPLPTPAPTPVPLPTTVGPGSSEVPASLIAGDVISFGLRDSVRWFVAQSPFAQLFVSQDGMAWTAVSFPGDPWASAVDFVDPATGWTTLSVPSSLAPDATELQDARVDVYATTDAGNSWRETTVDLPAAGTPQAAIHFRDAGSGELFVRVDSMDSASAKCFHASTTDGGLTWDQIVVSPCLMPRFTTALTGFSPSDDQQGILVTLDGGVTWSYAPLPPVDGKGAGAPANPLLLDVDSGGDLRIAYQVEDMVVTATSSNRGSSWQLVSATPMNVAVGAGVVGHDEWRLLTVPSSGATSQVMEAASHDGGTTWSPEYDTGMPGVNNASFIGPTGFALVPVCSGSGGCQNVLYSTANAGLQWQPLTAADGLGYTVEPAGLQTPVP